MKTKYSYYDIDKAILCDALKRFTNQIQKLLPLREEGNDWVPFLETIIVELTGMSNLLIDYQDMLFSLVCKLEGLIELQEEHQFQLYRRSIFECLQLLSKIAERVRSD